MSSTRKTLSALRSVALDINNPIARRHLKPIESQVVRCYNDIPTCKSFLPSQMGLVMSGGPGYLHEHCDKRHKQLGPIFREKLGSFELVFIADTDMIRTVIANEGSQPHHNVPEAWLLYNQVKGINRGLFFQVGEPWLKLRRAFNKVLLGDPAQITRYSDDILQLNEDLFSSWKQEHVKQDSECLEIPDVKVALCKWSIEATGLMLFGQRMGCIPSAGERVVMDSTRAEELVESVAEMFHQTSVFQVLPPKMAMKLNLGPWKKFEAASDCMIKIASAYAAEFIDKAKQANSKASIARDLLDMGSLTDDEIARTMVDLIIAAADTTSNSLQWILYSLAKHPNIQSRVHAEIENSYRRPHTDDGLDSRTGARSPYRQAVVKEVLRLYPTAPFLARTLDHSIRLNGYEIPPGTPIVFSLYTTSRKEEYFHQPLEFKPERWLRNTPNCSSSGYKHSKNYAYASLPFGLGSRMCIGRRMADLEMDLLIASIVDKFEILRPSEHDEVTIKLKMILAPSKPIKLQLKPRSIS